MEDIFISTVGVCDGVYAKISIFHLDINCLVDTGSCQTIISRSTFNRIFHQETGEDLWMDLHWPALLIL